MTEEPSLPAAGRRIVLGVGGGIAAYKAVEVARALTEAGADVRVVMTASATRFVGPVTFSTLTGNPVASELFPAEAPPDIPHTSLARSADVVVVAPATANLIAKAALGIADDLLSALLLTARAPMVMAPAMHTEMWEHEATQANVAALLRRGATMVGPASGRLAGPESGVGRMAEAGAILGAVAEVLGRAGGLAGRRIVVSAGGTQEPIDAVRFIGNRSSGRMGHEIAAEALRRGAKVTLVSAPSALAPPPGADVVGVRTAAEMREAVLEAAEGADAVVMAAAVADWRPAAPADGKLKKSAGPPPIVLEPTDDVLAELGRRRIPGQVVVGFCAETQDLEAAVAEKLAAKSADLVVGNLVGAGDSGFEVSTARGVILDREGRMHRFPFVTKRELAGAVIDAVAARLR